MTAPLLPGQETTGSRAAARRSRAWKRLVRLAGHGIVRLYRWRLGFLFGNRLAIITHTGRRSGRSYSTVVYVQGYDRETGEVVVVSVWGRSDWLKNLRAAPAQRVQIGNRVLECPRHRFLSTDEIAAVEQRFRNRDRLLAWGQARIMGWPWPADAAQLHALAADLRGVAFRPADVSVPD